MIYGTDFKMIHFELGDIIFKRFIKNHFLMYTMKYIYLVTIQSDLYYY